MGLEPTVASQAVPFPLTYPPSGVNSETHTFNGMFQLTQLQVGSSALNIQYNYSATQNNGKITSQTDVISGEQIAYTYDALNRLASAQTTQTGGTQWGQSYTYDGFGNLTDQTVIKGSAPDVHVAYNASNNLQTGDTADANGNIGSGYLYDIDNRLVQPVASGSVAYGYDVANKRIWRGDTSSGLDEIAFWAGQKLATYQVSTSGSSVYFTLTSTNVYFGGKLISKGSYSTSWTDKVALAPVVADRLGSIKKFYPYGTERPSASANDTEKFTGYYRDASTGLDYADQRYEQPGNGRFMTPDPYGGSAKASDPGSWNRYAYVGGDPVNSKDPSGLLLWVGGNGGSDWSDQGYFFPEYFVSSDPYFLFAEGSYPFLSYSPDQGGGGPGQDPNIDTVAAAVDRASDRIANKDCAGLFFSPENNTPENRATLSRQFQYSLGLLGTVQVLASRYAGNIPSAVPAFTNDDENIILIEDRSFFTNQVNGKPLSGAFKDLSLDQTQELILIHEYMHQTGMIADDDKGQSYTLANGQTVRGSAQISQAIRDNCFK